MYILNNVNSTSNPYSIIYLDEDPDRVRSLSLSFSDVGDLDLSLTGSTSCPFSPKDTLKLKQIYSNNDEKGM